MAAVECLTLELHGSMNIDTLGQPLSGFIFVLLNVYLQHFLAFKNLGIMCCNLLFPECKSKEICMIYYIRFSQYQLLGTVNYSSVGKPIFAMV